MVKGCRKIVLCLSAGAMAVGITLAGQSMESISVDISDSDGNASIVNSDPVWPDNDPVWPDSPPVVNSDPVWPDSQTNPDEDPVWPDGEKYSL